MKRRRSGNCDFMDNYPLCPGPAKILAQVCNTISRQPIGLESCSNHLRIQQVF